MVGVGGMVAVGEKSALVWATAADCAATDVERNEEVNQDDDFSSKD